MEKCALHRHDQALFDKWRTVRRRGIFRWTRRTSAGILWVFPGFLTGCGGKNPLFGRFGIFKQGLKLSYRPAAVLSTRQKEKAAARLPGPPLFLFFRYDENRQFCTIRPRPSGGKIRDSGRPRKFYLRSCTNGPRHGSLRLKNAAGRDKESWNIQRIPVFCRASHIFSSQICAPWAIGAASERSLHK